VEVAATSAATLSAHHRNGCVSGRKLGSRTGRHTCPVPHFFRHEVDPLVIGGPDHRTYLAFYLTLLVLLLSARDLVRRRQELVRGVLVLVSLVQQGVMYGHHLARGDGWGEALPLHICRVCTLLGLVWLLTGQDWAMQLVFHLGLFAYGSLVYPYGIEPRDHVMGWSFVVNHSLTLLLPVHAAIVVGWRPTLRGLGSSYLVFLAFLAVVERANRRTGGNYFYLRDRPVLRSLSDRRFRVVTVVGTAALFGVGYAVSRLLGRRWARARSTASTMAVRLPSREREGRHGQPVDDPGRAAGRGAVVPRPALPGRPAGARPGPQTPGGARALRWGRGSWG
jgi:hypothetical integral membrane protein (TIGR02206 family)